MGTIQRIMAEQDLLNQRYTWLRLIGEGGEGSAVLAYDQARAQEVILKILPQSASLGALTPEFTALTRASHPGIAKAFELGVIEAQSGLFTRFPKKAPFFSQEWLPGEPLSLWAKTRHPQEEIVQIGLQIAQALAHLHSLALLHRDISPNNIILLQPGEKAENGEWGIGDGETPQTTEGKEGQSSFAIPQPVLIDPGVGPFGGGTLPYAAPEALFGEACEASDLYSLGAVLYELFSGRPLFSLSGLSSQQALSAAFTKEPPPLSEEEASPVVREILQKLLRKSPEGRYQSAQELILALSRVLGRELQSPPRQQRGRARAPLIGRADELSWLSSRAPNKIIYVYGEEGIGKSRLLQGLAESVSVRSIREEEAPLLRFRGVLGELVLWLSLEGASQEEPQSGLSRVALALLARAQTSPVLVHLEKASPGLAQSLARVLSLQKTTPRYRWYLLLEGTEAQENISPALSLRVPPLDLTQTQALAEALLGAPLSAQERALLPGAAGNPGTLEVLLYGSKAEAIQKRASSLSPMARRALVSFVLTQEISEEARAELLRERWLTAEEPPRLWASSLEEAILDAFPNEAREVAQHANKKRRDLPLRSLARLYALTGEKEAAAEALEESARVWLSLVDAREARLDLERARSLSRAHPRRRAALLSELLLRTGDLEAAKEEALFAVKSPGESPTEPELRSLLSSIYTRQGQQEEAKREAQAGLSQGALSPSLEATLRAQAARAALRLGDLSGAKELSQMGTTSSQSLGKARLLEVQGLVALHSGEDAAPFFQEAKAVFSLLGEHASVARAFSTLGMAHQAKGQLEEATAAFQEALRIAGPEGGADLQASATYALNLGAALHAQGLLGDAEAAYRKGLELLSVLERPPSEQAGALYNYATLCLDLGELHLAAQHAAQAKKLAEKNQERYVEAYCGILMGDLAAAKGAPSEALSELQRARALFVALQNPRGEAYAAASLGRAALRAGQFELAKSALVGLRGLAEKASAEAERLELEGLWLLDGPSPTPHEAATHLAEAARLFLSRNEHERRFRALFARSRALRLFAPDAYLLARVEAVEALMKITQNIPSERRESFFQDPERKALVSIEASAYEEKKLARFLEISKRLNLELRVESLLEFILDAVVELVSAERGFLLVPEGDSLRVACARQMPGEEYSPRAPSRSIAEQAARTGEPVITIDAEADPRFIEARSVAGLKLRSVLVVPLKTRGKVLGCVYVDDRQRRGAFGERDVSLVRELGELAAIALENARLLDENQRRQADIERLNQALSQKVQEQQDELSAVREALERSGAELRSKYNYSNIIGRSPKMRALFSLVDRVTDAEAAILLCGESGTGKEIIARAIHYNGPRAQQPLVSENCAAIPEGLLESVLFGHVKGAFTGADRERKGLFELAHKGTLFLDEIGETSPKMQARLLRVLQEKEVRRVGADRPIPIDVRIITATNRDLRRMVEAGQFREDLYFRLAVVRVELPPLRERAEDIPLLVAHFLRQLPSHKRPEVSRQAMARLLEHPWPGNVRELENEVTRAALLCDGVIEERHLSASLLPVAQESPVRPPPPTHNQEPLKNQVEALEREALRVALAEARGNRSQVAKKLGLSRFGLQKKMRRYGLDE